ncbi:electron transport complex subunit RsxC [Bowmanella sp. JS7-9]|uniref:Ion-translocating oxidoreductase complex subunit C n=1 Tax=Pseudobowmanella zhangzhouensis TaxID=1537679 RepID=A0ABW1XMT7_9ALTE|nr:electron transport complex subunit RsxC [Bowmanella sp. JS7-9]TBX20605.1 electron transporter RnfC [Bowmanella sp. JS7-9]
MESLFNRLKAGRLFSFPGGVKPPERKALSNQTAIAALPLPDKLFVSLKQHIGVEGKVQVKEGDKVLKGQVLTASPNPFAVPVHAPTSGTVTRIGLHAAAHPSGLPEQTIEITPDGLGQWTTLSPIPNYAQLPKMKIIEAICNAGISGMGGAGFPTHLKISSKKDVEFLIINGVECEPYITADDRLMREHAWQIRQGIDILVHLLNPGAVLIAIEENKPEAIDAMRVACKDQSRYLVCPIPTRYPAGGEKQLIQNLLDREVPRKGLPIDVGVIMQNVGTCYAIADAIFSGKPLIERVVTLTGESLQAPGNYWVPLGTPVYHLLNQAKYVSSLQQKKRIIMGGPMMGFTLHTDLAPVVKTSNCVLVPSDQAMPLPPDEQSCIRCAACADACPASLLPQQLYWHAKANELERAQDFNLFDCIECGACAYVCPSDIPLVHYYRRAKADIRIQEQEKQKSDKARQRFEARNARLEREAEERKAKHAEAAERRRQAMQQPADNPQDKIAAALARVQAKKQAAQPDAVPEANEDKVAAAIARAKAKREAQQAQTGEPAKASALADDPKKAQVASAIARAKAKREAQQAQTTETVESASPAASDDAEAAKKARVAAAVARAKAKRDAEKADDAPESDAQPAENAQIDDADAAKKARVAAAVAKAKAKRDAEKADDAPESDAQPAENAQIDDVDAAKKARVAAALAKAKAKRDAEKAASTTETNHQPDDITQVDDAEAAKRARVKAAVARAKAKKAQQQDDPS